MADDPYDFDNDNYEESTRPNFEPSFMLNFEAPPYFESESESESDVEEFTGFTAEYIDALVLRKPESTRLATFHHRDDEERYT